VATGCAPTHRQRESTELGPLRKNHQADARGRFYADVVVPPTVTGQALWFIESHLAEELPLDRIAATVGVSTFHLCRAFAAATGHSVAAYARARRLTHAAAALANGAPDILDVALAAGYGSHEAFTRAFRQHFQTTPESVRAQASTGTLPLQEALRMSPTNLATVSTPRIVAHAAMTLVGMSQHYQAGANAGIPSQWSRFAPFIGHITNEVTGVSYGVVYHVDPANSFDYLCGVEVTRVADLPGGCIELRVPASTYAVFVHTGHISTIQATFTAIWERGLAEAGVKAADAPVLERYDEKFDPLTGLGGLEIWVPIAA
jgi:AraC family transcriptional regulator